MKNLIIPLFFLLSSISFYSQTEEDYLKTLDFVSKSFNEKKASQIYQKFNATLKSSFSEDAFKQSLDALHTEQGVISSYDLILDAEKEKNYLVEFESSSMLMLLFLSPEGEISTFEIKEY